jgi:hypothetical protein
MNGVTQLQSALGQGDPHAASRLLPLVYDELRKLAAQRMAQEQPWQTLQPTALVHEAHLRLVGQGDPGWDSRGHFFAAAAESGSLRESLSSEKQCRNHQRPLWQTARGCIQSRRPARFSRVPCPGA